MDSSNHNLTQRMQRDPKKLGELLSAIRHISGQLELDLLLARAMDSITSLVEADRSSLFLYAPSTDELWSKVAQGLDTKELRFSASVGLAGHAARSNKIINVPDAYKDERFSPSFDEKTGYRTKSVLCVPMSNPHGQILGVIQTLNKSGGRSFDIEDEAMLTTLGGHIAVFIENAQLHEAINELFESFILTSVNSIEQRDIPTSGHTRRVAEYATALARACHKNELGEFTRARIKQLRYAALLHDFGKIGVREAVLSKRNKLSDEGIALIHERILRIELERGEIDSLKDAWEFAERMNVPGFVSDEDVDRLKQMRDEKIITEEEFASLSIRRGNLTPTEWDDMRSHVERTRNILEATPWPPEYSEVPSIAAHHHEKLDGTGYPNKLAGTELTLEDRILAIADIYDALTAQDRPYKPAMPVPRAKSIILEEAEGGRLDGALVELFFSDVIEVKTSPDTPH